MEETDDFTNQLNKAEATKQPLKIAIQSLISLERSQKLDLLIHLISNLSQSLVLCGPAGIGKTKLLDIIQERKVDSWHICRIKATQELSFEAVCHLIVASIKQDYAELKHYDLAEMLDHFEQNKLKLVVVIDDAGELVPGLITTLCQYALANPVLRIVFVLTQDELYIKKSSDKAIDDCHFIELPPLTEKQCGEFLQNLSGKPDAIVSFNAISPALVEKIYQETHGIPGKIMAILPNLSNYVPISTSRWVLSSVLIVLSFVGVIGYISWNDSVEEQRDMIAPIYKEKTIPPAVLNQKNNILETDVTVLRTTPSIPSINQFPQNFVDNPKKQEQQFARASKEQIVATQAGEDSTQMIVAEKNRIDLFFSPKEMVAASSTSEALGDEEVSEPAIDKKLDEKNVDIVIAQAAANDVANEEVNVGATVNEDKMEHQQKDQQISADPEKEISGLEQPKPSVIADQGKEEEISVSKAENAPITVNKMAVMKTAQQKDDAEWVLSQPSRNYTLQLMVLSSYDSVKKLRHKFSQLDHALKYVSQQEKNKQKYIILYGSFTSLAQAKTAQKTLPKTLQQAWSRRFRGLQKKIKN
jgi:DamX protein